MYKSRKKHELGNEKMSISWEEMLEHLCKIPNLQTSHLNYNVTFHLTNWVCSVELERMFKLVMHSMLNYSPEFEPAHVLDR